MCQCHSSRHNLNATLGVQGWQATGYRLPCKYYVQLVPFFFPLPLTKPYRILFKFRYLAIVGFSFDGIMYCIFTLEHTREEANVTLAGQAISLDEPSLSPLHAIHQPLRTIRTLAATLWTRWEGYTPQYIIVCMGQALWICFRSPSLSLYLVSPAMAEQEVVVPPPGNSCGALCAQNQGRAWGIFAKRLEPRSLREDCMEET